MIINKIINILFPDFCISCGQIGPIICQKCISSFPKAKVNQALTDTNSRALLCYKEGVVKDLIWLFKYKNKKDVAEIISEYLAEEVESILSDIVIMDTGCEVVLVAIPIHKNKKNSRGYNQSDLLTENIFKKIKKDGLKIKYIKNNLIKIKDTPTLTQSQNKSERSKIIRDSMYVKDTTIFKDKTVILIDDVITSGATMHEAQRLIAMAGAKRVFGVAIAH